MAVEDDQILPFPDATGVDPDLVAALHACLFAAGEPVKAGALAQAVDRPIKAVRAGLAVLGRRSQGSGVELERVNNAWQLRTTSRYAPAIHRLLGTRPARLSQAALEVLAVIAYRQPVTRSEIEGMRGVDSGGVLKTLLDKRLCRAAGRSPEPGRPLLYRTTSAFLELFSLPNLRDLPTMAERESLARGLSDHEE